MMLANRSDHTKHFLRIIQMEAFGKAKTEKSTSGSVKCEGFAYCFFHFNGVMHCEFLPQGRTVNKEYNLEVIRRLCEALRQK